MIRFILPIFLLISVSTLSQDKLTKYYDSLWSPTSRESAFYYTEFTKKDTSYTCYSYWVKSNKLYCKSFYADTLFMKPRGLHLRYYENGHLEDSSYFYDSGELRNTYHYYPSGQLWAHYSYDKRTKKTISEGVDQQGKAIKDFIYMKEAEFPGGDEGWRIFLGQNLKTNVPIKNKAPAGMYKVIVSFVVSQSGKVVDIKSETNFGYGMEEEAIRVIRKSPRWTPLILFGEEKNAYRRQPISFLVTDEKQ